MGIRFSLLQKKPFNIDIYDAKRKSGIIFWFYFIFFENVGRLAAMKVLEMMLICCDMSVPTKIRTGQTTVFPLTANVGLEKKQDGE